MLTFKPRGDLELTIKLTSMSLGCRSKPEQSEETNKENSTQRGMSQQKGLNPEPLLLCGDSTNHFTTIKERMFYIP